MERKVGIMGGTFDPIHIGHLILAENAYEQFGLEKVVFMPSGNPPHKRTRTGRASNEERTEMVKLAIAPNPHFEISLEEMNEEGYSYTYRTLEALKEEHPDTEYFFILGADSLFDFDGWKDPQRICNACTLVAAARNHTPTEELDRQIEHIASAYRTSVRKLDTPNIDVSSNQIRIWISEGHTIRYYVPDSVIDYIRKNGVYDALKPNIHVNL
jgi:nicotinate-nucleotide adenylyltransferase